MREEICRRQAKRRKRQLLHAFQARRAFGTVVDLVRGCSHDDLVRTLARNKRKVQEMCDGLSSVHAGAANDWDSGLFQKWKAYIQQRKQQEKEEQLGLLLQRSEELDVQLLVTMEEMLKVCRIRDLSTTDTRDFLQNLIQRDVKPWLIDKVKKEVLRYKWKRVTSRKVPMCSQKQWMVELLACFHVLEYMQGQGELLWLDETGFGTSYLQNYCYELPGTPAVRTEKLLGHCHTMICTMSRHGFEHYQIMEERTNSVTFKAYMEQLGKKVRTCRRQKAILLMDNLTSHKTKEMMTFYRTHRWNVVFLPVSCPELNAIEFVFGLIKKRLIHQPRGSTLQYLRSVRRIMRKMDKKIFANLEEHVLGSMKKTLVERAKDLKIYP